MISARIFSTVLACWLIYPRYDVVWVGCSLLYAFWESVKWVLKLGRVWSS